MMEAVRTGHPPFRSLGFFTRADAAVFAGREEEIEEVATRILAGNTLVVFGSSGVGKTSLLCAGVVPALENRRGYRVTYVRPLRSPRGDLWQAVGADPAEPLAAALARLPAAPPLEAAALDADPAAASQASPRAPHVLVVDQLEELFTRFDESQRRPLWDGLVEVLEDRKAPVRLVLSLREEYLHLLDSAHPRLSNLLDRRYRLRGLTPFGARTAIVRPLVAGRIRYAPELVDQCVADLTEVPSGHPNEDGVVDPLLLQIVCSDVYRRAEQRDPGAPTLTLPDYAYAGGPAGVFARHLDELFSRVHVGDHLVLQLMLQEMTTSHATKLPATVSRLSRSGLRATEAEIQALLNELVVASLVRKYEAEPEPWYELVHDRLVQALPRHFARDQQFLRLGFMREVVSQLSKGFSEGMAGATLLSRDALVDLVEPFRKYIRFDDLELSLLFRSAIAAEHEVVAWRDAYEAAMPRGAPAIVREMLRGAETRRAAVVAVGALGITELGLRVECMRLALYDEDPHVAKVAAEALSVVAGHEEIAPMRIALKDRALRPRALQMLAALRGHAAFQAKISARDLMRAARLDERARLTMAKETIRIRGNEGLREGLRAGALGGLVTALFWCIVAAWFGGDSLAPYVLGIGAIAVMSPLWGSVCGRAASRAMAKLHVLDRPTTSLRAMRDPRLVATLVVAFFAIAAALLAMLQLDAVGLTVLVASMLLVPTLAVLMLAVVLTEWVVGRPWLGTGIQVLGISSSLAIPWVSAICTGTILVSFVDTSDVHHVVLVTLLCGAWCSACATAIARAFAESTRHLPSVPNSLRIAPRGTLGLAVAAVLPASVIVLLLRTPLPFWAPTVDVTRVGYTQTQPLGDSSGSWTSGRWLRFRNNSPFRTVGVVSVLPRASSSSFFVRERLLLVWPGTYSLWDRDFAIPIEFRSYLQVDLATDSAAPDTYTLVPLEKKEERGEVSWTKSLTFDVSHRRLLAHLLACRVFFMNGTTKCYTGDDMTNCQINSMNIEAAHLLYLHPFNLNFSEQEQMQVSVDLNCQQLERYRLDVLQSQIKGVEAVVDFFDDR